jgi:hypothetical protein
VKDGEIDKRGGIDNAELAGNSIRGKCLAVENQGMLSRRYQTQAAENFDLLLDMTMGSRRGPVVSESGWKGQEQLPQRRRERVDLRGSS